jgi:tetratricopeptide (TPR) repeat protein
MLKNKQIPLIYLLLTAATIIAFWQVNRCDFINYDDTDYVTENIHIRNGVTPEAIRWAFMTGYGANWHPLTWMSHMLDLQLFGLNPHRHHLVNLLFHVLNTLLLFFVFNRMTKAPWKSAFVAALFGLHPLHVESVAWVSERKDVLSTFFWMLTMVAYVRYVEHGGWEARSGKQEAGSENYSSRGSERGVGREESGKFLFPSSVFSYLAVLIFFALGLMSKPMLVSLPFVLLLLDYWPLGRMQGAGSRELEAGSTEREPLPANKKKGKSAKKLVPVSSPEQIPRAAELERKSADHRFQWESVRLLFMEKIPLFALAALSCIVTYAVQQKGGAVTSLEVVPVGVRIANALVSYVIYMEKTIWPNNLAVYYPYRGVLPVWQVAGALLLLGGATFAVVRWAKRFPYLATGWLWFAGTLVPVIGIVQVGRQAMADRYSYVPIIGLFIILAWGIPQLFQKWRITRFPTLRKEVLFAPPVLILACLSVVTWTQAGYWTDGISLYDHALKVTSRNDVIHYNRALAYHNLGDLKQAISDYDRAIEINPRNADVYNNRGSAYQKLGNYEQAISDYGRVIEMNPRYADVYNKRGSVYQKLGNHEQAISDFNRAIEIDPKDAQAYNNRGNAYAGLGHYSQAIPDYDKAIEADPMIALAYYNRGFAYGQLGDYRKAIENYDRAIRINTEYDSAYNNRGRAHWELGDRRQAIEDAKAAARLNNENAKQFLRIQGISW